MSMSSCRISRIQSTSPVLVTRCRASPASARRAQVKGGAPFTTSECDTKESKCYVGTCQRAGLGRQAVNHKDAITFSDDMWHLLN